MDDALPNRTSISKQKENLQVRMRSGWTCGQVGHAGLSDDARTTQGNQSFIISLIFNNSLSSRSDELRKV